MSAVLPVLDMVQQATASGSSGAPPFSVLQMGKSLFTLPFFTIVTAVFIGRAVSGLRRAGSEPSGPSSGAVDLVLFWGAFTLAAGLFHTFMSFISTTWSLQLYGPIGPEQQWMVWRGVMLGLIAGAYGLLVFMLTALVWLGLRRWQAKVAPA
jgi:hypothetical protein